jgi:putative component of membrane protein insertase Oxa1/YidC/SpoIIIJ protein YidD
MLFNRFLLIFIVLISFYTLTLYAEVGYYEPWGKDADLKVQTPQATPPQKLKLSLMGLFAEKMIFFHQRVLTKVDGPRSHFVPVSSQYMLEAIRKHGFTKGFIMGCDRLLRENSDPWVYRTIEINGQLRKADAPQ